MRDCCKKWVYALKPSFIPPRGDGFEEVHQCPGCTAKFLVWFEKIGHSASAVSMREVTLGPEKQVEHVKI